MIENIVNISSTANYSARLSSSKIKADEIQRDAVSGAGGGGGGVNDRVTALEVHFDYIRKDLDEIKAGQAAASQSLSEINTTLELLKAHTPTKDNIWNFTLVWAGIGLATISIVVGGIIGGLSILR